MNKEQLLDNLIATAEELGIDVRKAHMDGTSGGGICKLKSRWVLIIDLAAPLEDQIEATAHALKNRPEIENIYLRPQVRELIEH